MKIFWLRIKNYFDMKKCSLTLPEKEAWDNSEMAFWTSKKKVCTYTLE